MARLMKPTYTVTLPGGGRGTRKAEKWYCEYKDENDRLKRVPAYADKGASQALLGKLVKEARDRSVGLASENEEQLLRPLMQHVDDYERHLRDSGYAEAHIAAVVPRIRKIVKACRFMLWKDISASRVQAHVAGLRKLHKDGKRTRKGISIRTANFYMGAVEALLNWMVADGRAPGGHDKLKAMRKGEPETDIRHGRRAASAAEAVYLLEWTRKAPHRHGMSGSDRALLYRVAMETGFRANELRTLTPERFDLDEDRPAITVLACYAKNDKEAEQPIRPRGGGVERVPAAAITSSSRQGDHG